MAINPNLLVIKPVNELESVTGLQAGQILFYDGSNNLKKIDVDTFNNLSKTAKPLKPTDATPTVEGLYMPTESGTYNNADGLVAQEGYYTLFFFDGTNWTKSETKLPENTVKIPIWSATDFDANAQTIRENIIYIAPNGAGATDIPGESGVWEIVGSDLKLDVEGGALGYDTFINNTKKEVINNTQFSSFSTINIEADNVPKRYYTLFPTQSFDSNLKSITIKGMGLIRVNKIKPDGTGEALLTEIDLGTNDNIHTINFATSIIVEAGFLVGIQGIATGLSRFYFQVPKPSTSDFNLIQLAPYEESTNLIVAYNYILEKLGESKYYATPDDLENLESKILETITTPLLQDSFENNSNNWVANNWTLNGGKFTSSAIGMNNNLFLPLIWNLNKRKARIKFTPSVDSDFRIHLLSNNSDKMGEGSSLFSVNFAEKKLKIFNVATIWPSPDITSDGVDENSVLKEVSFNFSHINGREYLAELEYFETKHILTLFDTVTGESESLIFDGWAGGRQQQSYSFYVKSGGNISINNFEIIGVDNVENLFVGDSITEGVMVVDKSKRWWKQMEPKLAGVTAVSARGGHRITDVIAKFDNEILKVKPKRIVFLIGVNGNGTVEQYQELMFLCTINNITPCFAFQLAYADPSNVPINTNLREAIPKKYLGFRFDLATSINNDGTTCNTSLFYDGLHPIEAGCTEMAKRFFDVSFLKQS